MACFAGYTTKAYMVVRIDRYGHEATIESGLSKHNAERVKKHREDVDRGYELLTGIHKGYRYEVRI